MQLAENKDRDTAVLVGHKVSYILEVAEHKGNYMYFEVGLLDKDKRFQAD